MFSKLIRTVLPVDTVVIYEVAGAERSASEYVNHHMLADMQFISTMHQENLEYGVKIYGNTAVSLSRTKMSGMQKGKMFEGETMETMILRNVGGQWKIDHIHWSD